MFLHHEAEKVGKWVNSWDFDPIIVTPIFMVFLTALTAAIDPDAIAGAFAAGVVTSPVWLPVMLFIMFWKRWIHFVRFRFWFSQETVLLHIELPAEVEKSPLAIELVLSVLNNTGGEYSFIGRFWEGKFRATSSLEIASTEGRIGYYVHLRKAWRQTFEARLYGQYPEARITVVDDYAAALRFDVSTHAMWGTEYRKSVTHAVPIRTYIDWQLDKSPDTPETQVDPITHMLELLSALGPGEHIWMQIILRGHKAQDWYGFFNKEDEFKEAGKEEIEKIMKGAADRAKKIAGDDPQAQALGRGFAQLTPLERLKVESIERNVNKITFDCGIRVLYIAKEDAFKGNRIGDVVNFFNPFGSPSFNRLGVTRGHSLFNFPWQDWGGIRKSAISKRLYFWYKHRAYFFVPLDQDPVYMTTEELATLWHFPSSAVQTPGLARVQSRVGEAPANLPTAPANLPR